MRPGRPVLFLALLFVVLSQIHGPSERSGPSRAKVLWQFDAGGCLAHTPAVDGDMVYIASGDGVLGQLESATGKLRWLAVMGRNSDACVFRGPLMFTRNLVLLGSSSGLSRHGSLRAIERATGKQRWTQPAGRGLAPSLSRLGRRIFVPTVDGELWCLNVDSGRREWSVPFTVGDWGSPAVAVDRVFAGAADGALYALNAVTGKPEWRTHLGAPITTTVRRGNRSLFVGTLDGRVHRVDMRAGEILASRQLDEKLAPRSAPVLGADSVVVQLADDGDDHQALVSLDRGLSRERWRVTASDRWSTTRVFPWKSTVVVGTASGNILAYCASDGSPAWTHKMAGTVRAIGGAEDTMYIGTTDGRVDAVRPPPACGAGN